jgi:hypothetical protein
LKQSQTKELINQLSAAFSALIKHLWIKHKPSKNSLISSFWYLIFLIANGSIIAGLAFLFIKSDPDMAKLIFSTNQDSSTSSFWDIVASIGSLLAGLGTVGLLAFGWIKAGDWIKEAKHSRKLEFETSLAQTISKHAFDLQSYYNVYLIHKVIDGNMSDDQFFYKKLFNKYSIKIEESIVAAKTLVIIYHHENKQNYISGLNAQKLKILEEINDLFKLYEEKNHSNNIADLDKKLYEIGVENLQLCNFLKEISDEYFVSLSSS